MAYAYYDALSGEVTGPQQAFTDVWATVMRKNMACMSI